MAGHGYYSLGRVYMSSWIGHAGAYVPAGNNVIPMQQGVSVAAAKATCQNTPSCKAITYVTKSPNTGIWFKDTAAIDCGSAAASWTTDTLGPAVPGSACAGTQGTTNCPKNWWAAADTGGHCVQTCPLDSQTRTSSGRCKCGLGTPNENCIAGTKCVNNECVDAAPPAPREDGAWEIWANTGIFSPDVAGSPGSPMTGVTLDRAKQICRDLAGCVGFTFKTAAPGSVWFKSGPQGWSTSGAPGWTAYVFKGQHTPPPPPPGVNQYDLPGGLVAVPTGADLVQKCDAASQNIANDKQALDATAAASKEDWKALIGQAEGIQGAWHGALNELNALGKAIPLKTWEMNNKMQQYREQYLRLDALRKNEALLKQMVKDNKTVSSYATTTYYLWLCAAVAIAIAVTRALRK